MFILHQVHRRIRVGPAAVLAGRQQTPAQQGKERGFLTAVVPDEILVEEIQEAPEPPVALLRVAVLLDRKQRLFEGVDFRQKRHMFRHQLPQERMHVRHRHRFDAGRRVRVGRVHRRQSVQSRQSVRRLFLDRVDSLEYEFHGV